MADSEFIVQKGQARAGQDTGNCFNGDLSQTVLTLQLPDTSMPQCDQLFRVLTHAEKVDRYSTVFVRLSAGANAGSDLLLAGAPDAAGTAVDAGQNPTYEFFFTGLNDSSSTQGHLYSVAPVANALLPGEGSPWKLSQADTDGLRATDTNDIGANLTSNPNVDFFIAAVQLLFTGFYTAETLQGADPGDGTVGRRAPAFMDRVAGAYMLRTLRNLFRHATFRIQRQGEKFTKQTIDYRLGPMGDWPAYNEFSGGGNALSCGNPVPFAFKQLPLPILAGRSPKLVNDNRFRFFLDIDSRFLIENDPTNAVPGGLSSALVGAFANSMFAGIRLNIIGGMICVDNKGRPTRKVPMSPKAAAAFEKLTPEQQQAAVAYAQAKTDAEDE